MVTTKRELGLYVKELELECSSKWQIDAFGRKKEGSFPTFQLFEEIEKGEKLEVILTSSPSSLLFLPLPLPSSPFSDPIWVPHSHAISQFPPLCKHKPTNSVSQLLSLEK